MFCCCCSQRSFLPLQMQQMWHISWQTACQRSVYGQPNNAVRARAWYIEYGGRKEFVLCVGLKWKVPATALSADHFKNAVHHAACQTNKCHLHPLSPQTAGGLETQVLATVRIFPGSGPVRNSRKSNMSGERARGLMSHILMMKGGRWVVDGALCKVGD